MIIKENQTVYKCGYCSKYYLRKHHTESHEKKCRYNPNNKHKCFDWCKHLEKGEFDIDHPSGLGTCGKATYFKCTKFNKFMYSYKAENTNNINLQEEISNCDERMPLECEGYEYKDN